MIECFSMRDVGAQLLRQHLGDHVAGGVVVMTSPVSGVTGKRLEVELTIRAADEIRAPGLEIVHHIDNIVDPHARERGIDELAVVTEDVLEMKLWAVVRAHGGGETSTRHRSRSAGGAPLSPG